MTPKNILTFALVCAGLIAAFLTFNYFSVKYQIGQNQPRIDELNKTVIEQLRLIEAIKLDNKILNQQLLQLNSNVAELKGRYSKKKEVIKNTKPEEITQNKTNEWFNPHNVNPVLNNEGILFSKTDAIKLEYKLTEGEEAKEEVAILKQIIAKQNEVILNKDKEIAALNNIIDSREEQFNLQNQEIKALKSSLARSKTVNKVTMIVAAVVVGSVAAYK